MTTKQKPQDTSRLIRCEAAAAYLCVGKKRILQLIARGDLPYVQLGERANSPFLIDRADLDQFVRARKTRA